MAVDNLVYTVNNAAVTFADGTATPVTLTLTNDTTVTVDGMTGATLNGKNDAGYALAAENATVGSHVILDDGFTVEIGGVRLVGAKIGGGLVMSGATLKGKDTAGDTLDAENATVDSDRGQLGEILLELGSNAIQAMPGGGTLTLAFSRAAGAATFVVRDTGPGIPDSIRPRVFEPFLTTRREGTGMGLAMVQKISETLGGRLTLASSGASGTTFELAL